MFSGSFGVRCIVLCKCSGKYIDIYFNLKITYFSYAFLLWLVIDSLDTETYLTVLS